MCHGMLSDSRLWGFLLECDRDLAREARQAGCAFCGSPLHRADFPRKPRGGPENLPPEYGSRFSLCCSADDCRRRLTPPSVRFLGRKVYLKALIILVTSMRQGPTPQRLCELHRLFGVARRTLGRWQAWWQEFFPRTLFWKAARARFMPPLRDDALVWELSRVFDIASSVEKLLRLLRFLCPITTRLGLALHSS